MTETRPPIFRVYLIYDERALLGDTDDATVLESCMSLKEVKQTDWDGTRAPLGVVCEYDVVEGYDLVNERKLGTVPEVQRG